MKQISGFNSSRCQHTHTADQTTVPPLFSPSCLYPYCSRKENEMDMPRLSKLRVYQIGFYSDFINFDLQWSSATVVYNFRWSLQDSCHRLYLHSGEIVRVENRSLVEFYLGKMTFEQGFQLKIRGNTSTQRKEEKGQCMWRYPIQRVLL